MNRTNELFVITGFILILLSLSYAVIKTASKERCIESEERTERTHLPTKCGQYYADTTEQWINCMGVERK